MRDGQGAQFDAVLAGSGFDRAVLLDVVLADGTPVHLASRSVTIGPQVYEPDLREEADFDASQGGNPDGLKFSLQNTEGTYGYTDESGASPLDGATAIVKWAVSAQGANNWQVDQVCEGRIEVGEVTRPRAQLTIVADTSDELNYVSGEIVTLDELTPQAAETAGSGGISTDGGGSTGWRADTYFDWQKDSRLDYDQVLMLTA